MLLAHQDKDKKKKKMEHCQAEAIKLKPQSRKVSSRSGREV